MKKSFRAKAACAAACAALAAGSAAVMMTGCEGLDYSARAEGTGVQIIGAIVVLAKYHASPQQKAVAEKKAQAAFVAAARPAYQERRAAVQTSSKKKVAAVERDYSKRIAQAPKTAAPAADNAKLEAEKKAAIAKVQAEAAAELASVDSAWRSLGGSADHSVNIADEPPPAADVPTASTRDREALIASASAHMPDYIAVAVPARGIAAEQGGKATIMLWDTRRQRLASEDVLVLDRAPAAGNDGKVDGVTARFAGN